MGPPSAPSSRAVDRRPLSGFRPRRWYTVSPPRSRCSSTSSGGYASRGFEATKDAAGGQPDLATAAGAVWQRSSDPQLGAEFRLFFAVYGGALQAPHQFAGFLERVVVDWLSALVDAQGPDTDPEIVTRTATLVIATIRGLLLDLLATGDHARVQATAQAFLVTLERTGKAWEAAVTVTVRGTTITANVVDAFTHV